MADDVCGGLPHKDNQARLKTLGEIAKLPMDEAKKQLTMAIDHWDRSVRREAVSLLVTLQKADGVGVVKRAIETGKISTVFGLSLLRKCDVPESTAFLEGFLDSNYELWSSQSWDSIEEHSNPYAGLLQWIRGASFTKKRRRQLDSLANSVISEKLRSLSISVRLSRLGGKSERDYFCNRELESLYEDIDGLACLEMQLEGETPFKSMNKKTLQNLSTSQIQTVFDALDDSIKLFYLRDQKASKHFKKIGIDFGIKPDVEYERSSRKQPVSHVTELAKKLKVQPRQLGWIYGNWDQIDQMYQECEIPKLSGGIRSIVVPSFTLKYLQRCVLRNILDKVPVSRQCHGFTRKRSIVSNAKPHRNKQVVINLDLTNFFPSITAPRVFGVFRSLGYCDYSASLLTRICTFNGILPQGAPSSPAIANLIARNLDRRLQGLAKKIGAKYSRYADDITFSGRKNIVSAIPMIRSIIVSENFTVAEHKVRITGKGNRQDVTGIVVNGKTVSISRQKRRKLRAALHHLKHGQPVSWNGKKANAETLKGVIAFVGSVQSDIGANLQREYATITRG